MKFKIILDNREYAFCGNYGAVLKSYEKGVRQGDVRMIARHLFYAYIIWPRGRFKAPCVSWIPVQGTTMEWVKEFKDSIT